MMILAKTHDILTIGDCCVDLVLSGKTVVPEFGQKEKLVDEYLLEIGGSCTIFASQAAKLGLKTAVLGRVGNDAFGDLVLKRLASAGVDVAFLTRDAAVKTGITVAMSTGIDRAMLTYTGTIDVIGKDDIPSRLLQGTRHLHIGSYFLMNKIRPHYPAIIKAVKKSGGTVSIDTNWDPAEQWDGGLSDVLPLVDIFMPNENEIVAITGEPSIKAAIESLLSVVPVIVVKRGKDGATVHAHGESHAVPAIKMKVVDTVGAGDSFDAGFLYGYLKGMGLQDCARAGCACGSLKTRAAGGVEGQPLIGEITRLLGS